MKIKGFTPIFDSLATKYDPYTALVYGKIWRICDWSDMGICTMANETIAEQLGLSEKTIRRKKEILTEDGLIKVVGKSGITDSVSVCHEVVMRMELDYTPDSGGESVDSQSKTPDGESYKDSIKDSSKDILAGVLKFQGSPDPLDGYPADVVGYLGEYIKASSTPPVKSEKADWIKTSREWKELGVAVGDVKKMYQYARDNGWGIARPGSITKAYRMMKSDKSDWRDNVEKEQERLKRIHG